ncbi:gamma carbonic anhydrase family protein [Candidatus Woesearchaeota archaeon CG11_big_fil_rev_8_21_14_0_20_43_8]|nr:MAG: gamma carbonic anhydrase family protein [Candidatus Woesearchaeota archaeon CG11_big_fil_rev_8_21_14_0_20_43_8]PIO08982.1 MAG: gamma carbonic anhydrase family protein [Candidatus Woesearchaeota archaeon CG08_land_8_20_14_0_20_43_7]
MYLDKKPKIHDSCFIADNATMIGDVVIAENSSVWFGAVIRGDENSIRIDRNTNIQDNVVLHISLDHSLHIGENVTIGHGAIVHGCTIKSDSMIAMGAIIMDGAKIGRNCIIGAGAVVTENMDIPDGSIIVGIPAKVLRKATEDDRKRIQKNWQEYVELAKVHKKK